jgi:hypothetical protein
MSEVVAGQEHHSCALVKNPTSGHDEVVVGGGSTDGVTVHVFNLATLAWSNGGNVSVV